MDNQNILLIKARFENYDDYYNIRSEKKNLFWTGYSKPPNYEDFKLWFQDRINDPEREIHLMYCNKKCVGSLHLDYYKNYIAIGYSIMEESEGKGYATLLVNKAVIIGGKAKEQNENISIVKAWINFQNIASMKVAEKNGFQKTKNTQIKNRFGKKEVYYEYNLNI